MNKDRNFDDLAQRFHRNVYGSLKGQVRLKVLERDFDDCFPVLKGCSNSDLQILDVGAGLAQFSTTLVAERGHLVLNDISTEMLKLAHKGISKKAKTLGSSYAQRISIVQAPLQVLSSVLQEREMQTQYDLVLCHAVMEWMEQPSTLVPHLKSLLKPGGYLSLSFYNINGLAFKNLLRTNYNKFDIDNFKAFRGSLTPTHPQEPLLVLAQLEQQGFSIICKSGIRVFHDYILDPAARQREPEALVQKELEYSRREPFWQMARYIHFMARYD